jgi:hypothetical protein
VKSQGTHTIQPCISMGGDVTNDAKYINPSILSINLPVTGQEEDVDMSMVSFSEYLV